MKNTSLLLLLIGFCSAPAYGQEQTFKPGVTAWVYETGEEMRELPLLIDGQTPNVSGDFPQIDFSGAWERNDEPSLESYFFAKVHGWIVIEAPGSYEFRLTSDDGGNFYFGPESIPVIQNDPPVSGGQTGELNLLPGEYPFSVDYYQNTGASRVLLEWKTPDSGDFEVIPTEALRTEEGQTHVTSPGLKGFTYESGTGGTAGGPGDGRPLEGVHPSYDLVNFRPDDFQPAVGGMDFLPDGRLAVCTWDDTGSVYLLDNLDGTATVHRFATGLGEPLGLKVLDGEIYVTQKQEVTKLVDNDGDDIADEYIAVAHGWPTSFNYHEFSMNLEEKDGFLWIATSVPLRTGDTAYLPGSEPAFPVPNGPGSLLKIDPGDGSWEIVATGLRTPNGMGIGPEGELFGCDNQGEWVPTSRLNHLRPGGFYGHPQNPESSQPYTRPVLWLPHGEISNSPAQPILVPNGTYGGQLLIAELTHGGIIRANLEKVRGQYQGAAFRFTQGLESGMNRLAWGPDGALYAGGLGSGGNWNWKGTTYGLQKLRPNDETTFEMKEVHARQDGMVVEFTQPVPFSVLANPENYRLQQYRYEPEGTYGGPKKNVETLAVSEVLISEDRRRVFLEIAGLREDRVVALRLRNFMNDAGISPWSTEAWYTLNLLPEVSGPGFTPIEPPLEDQIPVSPQIIQTYEAEDAELDGPETSSEHSGTTGSGYADYGNSAGETITWTVTSESAMNRQIAIRYANGSTGNRPLSLRVNGSMVANSIDFSPSGGWPSWQSTPSFEVELVEGENSIVLTSLQNSGPNVDSLLVSGPEAPPEGATLLFDGSPSSFESNWNRDEDGTNSNWLVSGGELSVVLNPSPNDISTVDRFEDYRLHLEWLSPPGGAGQQGGNSGLKLHRNYELQILNTSPAATPQDNTAGAIYQLAAPDANASLGAGQWQSYDIDFTAPRWDGREKIADARATIWWNGVRVHTDVEIPGPTGASPAEAPGPQKILLQSHSTDASGPVRFRNIWLIEGNAYEEKWQEWLGSYQIPESEEVAHEDWDADGLSNFWEYVVGLDPTTPNSGESLKSPAVNFVRESGEDFVEFSMMRSALSDSRGLRFQVETSPNLAEGSWEVRSVEEMVSPLSDSDREQLTLRVSESISDLKKNFARIRVDLL